MARLTAEKNSRIASPITVAMPPAPSVRAATASAKSLSLGPPGGARSAGRTVIVTAMTRAIRNWRQNDQRLDFRRPREWARCPGRTKKHSMMDAMTTAMTTSGRVPMIWPMVSRTRRIGAKAAIVVRLAPITGVIMWPAPSSAAVNGSSPRLERVAVCSPTTMASSTMMPSVMISANSEIMLMVWPLTYMKPMVAIMATGMPAATQKAMRALRKTKRMAMTTNSPWTPLRKRSSMRSLSPAERSS